MLPTQTIVQDSFSFIASINLDLGASFGSCEYVFGLSIRNLLTDDVCTWNKGV